LLTALLEFEVCVPETQNPKLPFVFIIPT